MRNSPAEPNREFMFQAIMSARCGRSEDARPHPKVGALVVRQGSVVGTAYRGELAAGEHAEFTLLQKKSPDRGPWRYYSFYDARTVHD